ncbi:MAG TPA: DinB family protein [Gemmatimonadaceae bacterium]|nr:DinB family protein [Gemmatimonadaceae bacterium]
MTRPKSDFEALRRDLHEVYDGDPWHGSSITSVLDGVDADVASRRSIPSVHTIWELVLHMAVWTREVASRVRGADAKSPPEDWPAPRFGGGEPAWQAAKEDLAEAQKELELAVNGLKPEDLMRWIGDQRDPSLGTGLPVGTVIRGLMQHHTYHQGQIALLKRAAETKIED